MNDDLVKRLREDQPVTQDMTSTLQCALQDAAADRIEELEAKLAKAAEALRTVEKHMNDLGGYDGRFTIRKSVSTTLAELKGEK